MKKKLIAVTLGLLVLSTACSNKTDETSLIDSKNTEEQVEISENKVTTEDNKLGTEDNSDTTLPEDSTENEEDLAEEDQVLEENEEDKSLEEKLLELKEEADYISVIKMSQTGSTGKEINIIEDLKGSLRNIVIPEIPNLEANQTYLIFLKDSESGDIVPVKENEGLIKIKDEYDQPVVIIRDDNSEDKSN